MLSQVDSVKGERQFRHQEKKQERESDQARSAGGCYPRNNIL